MKKFIYTILTIALVASCAPKDGYVVEGKIKGLEKGELYVKTLSGRDVTTIDTVQIEDGEFEFEGKVDEPQIHLLFINGKPSPIVFFIENSAIKIKADIDSLEEATIKGSKANIPWAKFNSEMPLKRESQTLKEEFLKAKESNNIAKMNELRDQYNEMVEKQNNYFKSFVLANTNNYVGAYLAVSYMRQLELADIKSLLTKLQAGEAKNSEYVKVIENAVKELEAFEASEALTKVGNQAPDFTFTNLKGESKTLTSFKGKVVLIDFWASWCTPCRAESPNVVAIYKKHSKNNFDIVSISLDREEQAWKDAIQKDGLIWDNHFWDKEGKIANIYGVKTIPHTLLIGKDGTILYKDLRGEELAAAIKSLL
ncbi:MAG: redoxin domain-containing protein [Breznakibacter sp.]|nr:redoxin domain-containing protein [Breznakibacter sp.]